MHTAGSGWFPALVSYSIAYTPARCHLCSQNTQCRPPELLANVQEDLLQALRLDTEKPRTLAIFVDGAGYMVSMHRMAVVTYLSGSLKMPRHGLITPSLRM